MPHAPPTVVAVTLIESGNVRAVPLTVVSVTTGSVRSTLIVLAPVVPVLPAASVCVAVIDVARRRPTSAVAGVKVQVPAVQVAVPFCVLAPVIDDRDRRAVADGGAAGAADGGDRRRC